MFARSPAAVTVRSSIALASLAALAACSSAPLPPAGSGTGTVDCAQNPSSPACDAGGLTDNDTIASTDGSATDSGSSGTDSGDGTATDPDSAIDAKGGTDGTSQPDTKPTGNPPSKFMGYPSAELHVRIVGPNGRGHATVSGQIVEVGGVLFGNADDVSWTNEDNGSSGKATGSPFFQTDPIKLGPGDNHITVTATNKTETVKDSIIVTYNNTFSFQDRLRLNPSVLKVGKDGTVVAQIAIGKSTNIQAGSIKLVRVDDTGATSPLGPMNDDGDLGGASGDEIKGDGIYGRKLTVDTSKPGIARYRVTLTFTAAGNNVGAQSDIASVEIVDDWNSADCTAAMAVLKSAGDAATASGGGAAGQVAALEALKASAVVESAGAASNDTVQGSGVWVRFKGGVLGAVDIRSEGNRSGGSAEPSGEGEAISTVAVKSKRALLLDSIASAGADEVATAAAQMDKLQCPAYTVDSFKDGTANLRQFRHMYEYGIVAVAGHGDAYFKDLPADVKSGYGWQHKGSQEVVWTGHAVQCNYFGTKGAAAATCSTGSGSAKPTPCGAESECLINGSGGKGICVDHLTGDLRRGRVILGAGGTYGITPAFVPKHAQQTYPRSMVYLGTCRSLWNGSMAGELIAAGAAAVAGYNGYVSNAFATKWGATFFDNLIGQKQLSGVAHVQIEDTKNPGTFFSMVGAQNLDAANIEILNSSFEAGNLEGWIKGDGDGRVISQLGSTDAVAGKFMAIVSTGLGFTVSNGEIRQKFCIPAGKSQFSFWWKLYSEEFKEYCGSQYQDQFLAKFEGKVGGNAVAKTVIDTKIDDLCQVNEGGCSKCGKLYKGLTQADVKFDQGGAWMTPWVHATADISPFAGNGNVVLRFFTQDQADSAYDTAVLFDKIEFD